MVISGVLPEKVVSIFDISDQDMGTPFLLLTGHGNEDVAIEAHGIATGYFRKPEILLHN